MKRNSAPGFSLGEVLVVATIVAVLAGILLAVVANARNQARKPVCASNLRQIGAAAMMYQSDHDGQLPPMNPCWGPDGPDPLASYGTVMAIYHCSSSKIRDQRGYETETDYLFRFMIDVDSRAASGQGHYRVHPQSESVLAWDWNHTDAGDYVYGPGIWLVLRGDGSTGRVQTKSLRKSYFIKGNWTFDDPGDPNAYYEFAFPDEPWPPEMDRLW